MKLDFEDGGFIEIKVGRPGKLIISLASENKNNPLQYIVNSCELSFKEFDNLISDIKPLINQ